jgi:hypothetical protein
LAILVAGDAKETVRTGFAVDKCKDYLAKRHQIESHKIPEEWRLMGFYAVWLL